MMREFQFQEKEKMFLLLRKTHDLDHDLVFILNVLKVSKGLCLNNDVSVLLQLLCLFMWVQMIGIKWDCFNKPDTKIGFFLKVKDKGKDISAIIAGSQIPCVTLSLMAHNQLHTSKTPNR